ncbi:DUF2442 domain-containing protein [Rhodohalobacter sulfatireducens]|uniref:DUF2442 domain-containing protein n=1 Tax=Rhodohalobacter sulfatireducens TaxID=2911366 RepID=A0ABS9KAV7_9BACT|nr:DUF2442 domain-containing protein [Rhodohalobacter sulfatireducens]MCG2587963.1 DUF2442 domain-containing protein [Rhodohalobacter sulfatireducens]
MSTLVKNKLVKATDLEFTEDSMRVFLEDGREITVPIEWFPKLRDASIEEKKNWRLIGNGVGIHWESLDEDISVKGLLS